MIKNKPTLNNDAVYTQSQAARALDVDRHTIARYVRAVRWRAHAGATAQ